LIPHKSYILMEPTQYAPDDLLLTDQDEREIAEKMQDPGNFFAESESGSLGSAGGVQGFANNLCGLISEQDIQFVVHSNGRITVRTAHSRLSGIEAVRRIVFLFSESLAMSDIDIDDYDVAAHVFVKILCEDTNEEAEGGGGATGASATS